MQRRDFLGALVISPFLYAPAIGSINSAMIATKNGVLNGKRIDDVFVFKGIPYGQDTKNTRFMPPIAKNWDGVLNVYEYGFASPQTSNEPNQSEDCLYLNIWTPALDNKKRAVMFYIHGGAYSNGSGSDEMYDGARIAREYDVVVVTINHRLNAFGYLYLARLERELTGNLGKYAQSGNVGQLDIMLALNWVKANISQFGGDASRVLAFGQSGGGAKIATLMATPSAKGLFSRALTMSGQQVTASGGGNATKRAQVLLNALGLKADIKGLELLYQVPQGEIIAALKSVDPIIGSGGLYMGPVLDEVVLFNHPFYPHAFGWGNEIPMIIGNTHDETRAFLGNDLANHNLTWDDLPKKLPPQYRVDIDPYLVIETYRKLYPNYTASQVFFAATTAGRSWRGAIIEAQERAKINAPTWAYQFDFQSQKDNGKWGAPHTIDIPFAFQTLGAKNSYAENSLRAQKLAKIFSQSIANFAKTGNPQTNDLPKWQNYKLPNRQTMLFDDICKLANDPRGQERKLFEKVPFIQQGT
jgi:para-nitrobenzyl esterase